MGIGKNHEIRSLQNIGINHKCFSYKDVRLNHMNVMFYKCEIWAILCGLIDLKS